VAVVDAETAQGQPLATDEAAADAAADADVDADAPAADADAVDRPTPGMTFTMYVVMTAGGTGGRAS
jgi:hypothetical protein